MEMKEIDLDVFVVIAGDIVQVAVAVTGRDILCGLADVSVVLAVQV